jgi:hypothetical protein
MQKYCQIVDKVSVDTMGSDEATELSFSSVMNRLNVKALMFNKTCQLFGADTVLYS